MGGTLLFCLILFLFSFLSMQGRIVFLIGDTQRKKRSAFFVSRLSVTLWEAVLKEHMSSLLISRPVIL